jgi:hypothetical protein
MVLKENTMNAMQQMLEVAKIQVTMLGPHDINCGLDNLNCMMSEVSEWTYYSNRLAALDYIDIAECDRVSANIERHMEPLEVSIRDCAQHISICHEYSTKLRPAYKKNLQARNWLAGLVVAAILLWLL